MGSNNIIKLAVGVTVGIILITGMIWPTISDYVDGESETFVNQTSVYQRMAVEDDPYRVNIVMSYDFDTDVLTVNGVTSTVSTGLLFSSDRMYVTIEDATLSINGYNVTGASVTNGELFRTTEATGTLNLSIVNGAVTLQYASNTFRVTPSEFIAYRSTEGTYCNVTQSTTTTYYVNSTDQIYGAGKINTNNLGYAWFHGSDAQIAGTDVGFNFAGTAVEGFVDLYTFTTYSCTYGTQLGTNLDGTSFTPFTMIIPIKVSAVEESNALNVSMLMIVGLMVVLLLLVAVARNLNMR